MKSKTTPYIPLIIAGALLSINIGQIISLNIQSKNKSLIYLLEDPVQIGAVALILISLSTLIKGKLWIYLFTLVILLSFFPFLAFTNQNVALFIGNLKLDLIAIPLLVAHVFINHNAFSLPKKTVAQLEAEAEAEIDFFIKKFQKKSREELTKMSETDRVPAAKMAIKRLLMRES